MLLYGRLLPQAPVGPIWLFGRPSLHGVAAISVEIRPKHVRKRAIGLLLDSLVERAAGNAFAEASELGTT